MGKDKVALSSGPQILDMWLPLPQVPPAWACHGHIQRHLVRFSLESIRIRTPAKPSYERLTGIREQDNTPRNKIIIGRKFGMRTRPYGRIAHSNLVAEVFVSIA